MRDVTVRAHPRETGGILVGVSVDGRPWVTHACEVRSLDAGPAHYVLPAGATRSEARSLAAFRSSAIQPLSEDRVAR